MHNPVIRHLNNLWSGHPDKSGTHLTPYIEVDKNKFTVVSMQNRVYSCSIIY